MYLPIKLRTNKYSIVNNCIHYPLLQNENSLYTPFNTKLSERHVRRIVPSRLLSPEVRYSRNNVPLELLMRRAGCLYFGRGPFILSFPSPQRRTTNCELHLARQGAVRRPGSQSAMLIDAVEAIYVGGGTMPSISITDTAPVFPAVAQTMLQRHRGNYYGELKARLLLLPTTGI